MTHDVINFALQVEEAPTFILVVDEGDAVDLRMDSAYIVKKYDGETYDGDYTVIPLAGEAVILPTTDKILTDDITVTKIPYFETSNEAGTTVYIASEV